MVTVVTVGAGGWGVTVTEGAGAGPASGTVGSGVFLAQDEQETRPIASIAQNKILFIIIITFQGYRSKSYIPSEYYLEKSPLAPNKNSRQP
jgi:hypothetical protein